MRIGMLADVYEPHVSGITNYIRLNRQALERAGHEVFIFTFGDPDYPETDTHILRSTGLPLSDTGYYLSLRYIRPARTLLQTMDVAHVHHPFVSGRLALRYCRPLDIPVVFTNHTRYDLYARAYLPMIPDEMSTRLIRAYMPSFCAQVDQVIAPSAGMAGVLRSLGVTSPIEVVPNGVEVDRYYDSCADCRAEMGYREDDILLVYSGRLAPEKNMDLLMQACLAVAEKIEQVRILVIGGGPEEERLRKLAAGSSLSGRIRFTGMIPYPDLPRHLAMCDIFVTASLTEVHPLSVIEAMASGLPVVGIRSVGVGDTVEDGVTGLLAENDPASFTSQIARLCNDRALRVKLGAAARQASRQYAIEKTSQIMLAHYEQLVREKSRTRSGFRHHLRRMMERWRK
jgi:glycosyltransferase involved in cell wall biosynthesis